MTFIIRTDLADSYSPEELAEFTEDALTVIEETFENTDVTAMTLKLEIPLGSFEFGDGSVVPFQDYKVVVVSAFRTPAGDRWFGTADGGRVNASDIVRKIRKVVLNVRGDTE